MEKRDSVSVSHLSVSRRDSQTVRLRLLARRSQRTPIQIHNSFSAMNSKCVEVDELILQLADYKNDYTDMAAEKLLRMCSRSWEAYQYLQDRVYDAWLPDSARQQLRRIINRIRMRMHQQHEYGWVYNQS